MLAPAARLLAHLERRLIDGKIGGDAEKRRQNFT